MKKLSILVGAITLTSSLFAQDLTSKKGEAYLPETGDWALGIDAVPFLNYIGNFIGGNGDGSDNVAPNWGYITNNQTIFGKYFVDEKTAYRGSLRIGFGSDNTKMMVIDRAQDQTTVSYPTLPNMKENSMKSGGSNIGLSGGMEWRKGNTRLQGFFGGELGFNMSGGKSTFTYGNALTSATIPNAVGITAADGNGIDADGNGTDDNLDYSDSKGNPARLIEGKSSSMGVGLRGFIGAEYFILPKLAIGGEFGWGLMFTSSKSSWTKESVGNDLNGNSVVGKQSGDGTKTSGFGIDTDAYTSVFGNMGQLRITLHF